MTIKPPFTGADVSDVRCPSFVESDLAIRSGHKALRALNKVIIKRRPSPGLMIDSDRGVQYASSGFREVLQKHDFMQSMSRKGNRWDNAVAEAFFHTIKTQMIHHCKFKNIAEAGQAIFTYIEVYYNRQRQHSTNGY